MLTDKRELHIIELIELRRGLFFGLLMGETIEETSA